VEQAIVALYAEWEEHPVALHELVGAR
jgi:hypothetical protein